ncbi:laminin subunit alpha-1 isoform X1 [Oncorhynchus tshawytscha]|uniref:Laminin subunit alpha-1 n=1 Tax=Oncorhynchus tshawytscha TaxID=74940 RepID=A0AAZ3PWQ8_ONCTS|nr:laminin subunit alpha-1 isoform X1 [Oncorhynchus tshawytscha]
MKLFFCAIVLLWASSADCQQRGLFPAILNLASNAEITTNATCGEPEPEMYCKLVEHVPGRRIRNSQCRTCNAQSQNPKEQHPITNAIDGTNGWWQSPSIKNGRQFHLVTITLDLRQIFQVAYIIIKAANSPRPGNWVLERSMDGVEFTPWQYYAISDTECLTRYNITPRFGPPTYKRDDEVICTSYYSRLVPLEHGEIHTSLINGRPSADQLTPELLDFTSARYIRLRLQRIRTLNADLMTLSYRDPKEVDPIVTRRYYYSIKDISVGGMCICYGHAQSCPWDPVAKKLQCVCEHNTCGESCNECCPGYHQEPWQPGTLSNGNTCEKCNCHNKAEDCYYNQTMDDHKMSMNSHGHFHGGGVCIDCTQNTAGVNCETCADGFYRPHEVSPYSENPCVECGCDMRGSLTPTCIRDDNHAKLEKGLNPGQCLCKEGFVGEHCERCAFGYRDFPLCSRCECSLEGSLNIDPCTECICKENVMGANCDLCKQGFYNLEDRNPEGCTECFCFGVSDVCESSPWSLFQTVDSNGWLLPTQSVSIYTAPLTDDDNNLIVPSITMIQSYRFVSTWAAPEGFLGNRLTSYGGLLNYTVAYDVSVDNVDNSLPSQFDLIIEGNGRTLRQTPPKQLFLTPLREQLVSVELLPQGFVDVHTGQRVDRDELMTVLADLAGLRIRGHLNASAEGALRLSTVSLDMADIRAANPVQARDVEQCECPWGYLGTSCEFCSSGFYRVGGILFGGNCLQCECNDHATECDINGVCLDCTHNTTGPHCNQCLPGYYGDTSEGTPEDCQRCACPLIVATNNFSPTCLLEGPGQVTCDQCQQGYTGTKCERCANGYHGDPNVAGKECVLCECNGNVDPWDPGHCDTSSGVCLKCHSHTSGDDCERCEDGYYGDAITAKNCQACSCHGNGSYSAMCDLLTGQCTCKPNVVGEKCDQCQVGFHSLLSGQGCRDCNCSQSGSVSTACEEEGRCQCIPGVAGDKCDRCYHGYFNYQDRGCTQCECAHTHGNCNATTGKCICPPHTIGEKCELCEEGHWGHDTVAGCKSCDCSEAGSSATQCDLTNGQCLCRPDFARQKCDQCTMGYRGYPECTACNCNINGTREEFCDKELGLCSCEAPGNCVCKDNVGGGGCDECKKGSFGLSGPNPDGCSPCFCFGVSSDCEELGGMVRVPITLGSDPELLHVVSQRDPQGSVEGVYYQASDMLLDTREKENITLPGPYYWRLPKHYQGNKLLSYGGKLSYMVAFYALDGAGLANYEPQVLMRGGHLGKKVIYIDMPAPDNRVKTRQDVPLTEHKWKYFNSVSEKAVSHSDFLAVLSNIEYITIKASYGTGLQQSRISNITMDTALEAEEGSEGLEVACLIETCECPAGYAGLSCQECSPGYYRQPVTDLNLRGKRPLIQPCVPCQCNNHSQACDLDTGECLGCQHNTAGEHCNVCGSGYYGNVKGSVSDCSLCACPLKENSFSPTCAMEGVMGDFRCNACKPGYEGRYCERCSVGYYGNPSGPGGKCEACQCSTAGSLHLVCDSLKGQCECKAGVRGHLCDQCEARHVLDGDQCVSCDDECTGVLLDDLDALESSFLSVNLTGVILSPYSTLVSLENDTREVKNLMSWESSPAYHLNRVEEDLTNLTQDIDGLLRQATGLSADGEEVAQSTENSVTQGAKFLEYIITIHTAIQVLAEEAAGLNRTENVEKDEANSTRLWEQVAAMLETIKLVNLSQANASVSTELSATEALLQRVLEDLLEPQGAIESQTLNISNTLTEHHQQLEDAHALLMTARENNNHTHTLLGSIYTNLPEYQGLKQNVSRLNQTAETQLEETQDILADAVNLAEDMSNVTSQLEGAKDQLEQWNPMLRKHVDTLVMELRKKDALELVYKAEDHARELSKKAQGLQSSLVEVMNTTLNATSAEHGDSNIRANVQPAEEMANLANLTATMALNMIVQPEESFTDLGSEAVQRSEKILAESLTLRNSTEGLVANISDVTDRIALLKEKLCNTSRLIPEQGALLHSLPNGTSEQVLDAKEQAALANTSLQRALERLEELRVRLEKSSTAVAQTRTSISNTNQLFSDSQSTASTAESKLKEAESRTERLYDRLKPLKTLGENLSRNLSEIREMINQARKQAASIKVAVLADKNCVRAYTPEVSSSNFNTLTMTVKTSEPDNLLFYMGSSSSVDFMAVEMQHGKVAYLWDTGSGHAKLEYPDVQINNNKWHHINATRFGRHGTLSVHQLESEPLPAVKTTSPGSATILEVNKSTLIFVGGLGGQIKSSVVKMTQFKGCMGEASLNEKNIGLWNYAEREGQCRGCFMSPQTEETSFHFDGSGYSVVEKPLRSTSTSIVMLFKTLSPNGLLLYLASNGTRDFLSIELVEGQVRLTFELGSGPLTLTSNKAYNTGSWYKITLQRNKRKVYMAVMAADNSSEKEIMEAESPGTASDLNRSDLDPIYIGGLPMSRPIRRQVVARSYVGCIKNMEIARSNFDLLRDSYGVKKGCVLEPIRSVSVLREGYVELPSVSLDPQGELLASFSTRNDTGIILAGFSKAGTRKSRQARQPFLAVMLISGRLEVHVNMAEGGSVHKVVVKSRSGSFSDGQEHSVILQRNRKMLVVLVDEDHQEMVRLSSEKASLTLTSLYMGGVPPGEGAGQLRTTSSFYGCIRNLALDSKLLDLSAAVRYRNVDMDSCLLEERPKRVLLPDDTDLDAEPTPDPARTPSPPPGQLSALTPGTLTCASMDNTSSIPEAQQFGISRHSHMVLSINPNTVRRSFSLELSVRTYTQSGLIYYMAHANQMDYATLQLLGGHLFFTCDKGSGPATATFPVPVNDGQWHTVKTDFNKKSVVLSVDGQPSTPVPAKGNTLDVENKLYLGGLPQTYTAKKIGNVTHSLAGCIQKVLLNSVKLNTQSPVSEQSTAYCFTAAQDGTFFNGSGYAALIKNGYKVGSDMEVSLEFRSTVSDGVLLGVSSAKVDAIGLELANGQAVFHVNNGAGRVSATSRLGWWLCDGLWHTLLAKKTKNALSLTVDGVTVLTDNPHPQSTSAETKDPVYVGGFPVGVKQNCLTSRMPFRGCMRNIRLIKGHMTNILDFSTAFTLHGVSPHSCPSTAT